MKPIAILITTDQADIGAEGDAGYIERLRTALAREKATSGALQAACANRGRTIEEMWRRIEAQDLEIVQLKAQVDELGRKNLALAAQAEQAEFLEREIEVRDRQLEAADKRIDELEAALAVAQLPADSRDNVIGMVRRAAA